MGSRLILAALLLALPEVASAALAVSGLRCEGVDRPEQVDTTSPQRNA